MIVFGKPSPEVVERFISAQSQLGFTYSAVGATASIPPLGYIVDHTRTQLGESEHVFEAAKAALKRWEHFRFSWLEAGPITTPIEASAVVAVMAHRLGVWWLNAARIINVIDEGFCVEWHERDNSVWYDILAFSRPRHFLARLGYPVVRRIQKQFARSSCAAMQRAVAADCQDF
jgi:uncharacterized protein (UPF0548 family)